MSEEELRRENLRLRRALVAVDQELQHEKFLRQDIEAKYHSLNLDMEGKIKEKVAMVVELEKSRQQPIKKNL